MSFMHNAIFNDLNESFRTSYAEHHASNGLPLLCYAEFDSPYLSSGKGLIETSINDLSTVIQPTFSIADYINKQIKSLKKKQKKSDILAAINRTQHAQIYLGINNGNVIYKNNEEAIIPPTPKDLQGSPTFDYLRHANIRKEIFINVLLGKEKPYTSLEFQILSDYLAPKLHNSNLIEFIKSKFMNETLIAEFDAVVPLLNAESGRAPLWKQMALIDNQHDLHHSMHYVLLELAEYLYDDLIAQFSTVFQDDKVTFTETEFTAVCQYLNTVLMLCLLTNSTHILNEFIDNIHEVFFERGILFFHALQLAQKHCQQESDTQVYNARPFTHRAIGYDYFLKDQYAYSADLAETLLLEKTKMRMHHALPHTNEKMLISLLYQLNPAVSQVSKTPLNLKSALTAVNIAETKTTFKRNLLNQLAALALPKLITRTILITTLERDAALADLLFDRRLELLIESVQYRTLRNKRIFNEAAYVQHEPSLKSALNTLVSENAKASMSLVKLNDVKNQIADMTAKPESINSDALMALASELQALEKVADTKAVSARIDDFCTFLEEFAVLCATESEAETNCNECIKLTDKITVLRDDVSAVEEIQRSSLIFEQENASLNEELSLLKSQLHEQTMKADALNDQLINSADGQLNDISIKLLKSNINDMNLKDILLLLQEAFPYSLTYSSSVLEKVAKSNLQQPQKLINLITTLCHDYLPQILAGESTDTARSVFTTYQFAVNESDQVKTNKKQREARTFDGIFYANHLRITDSHRIYFRIDDALKKVVIGYIGEHL